MVGNGPQVRARQLEYGEGRMPYRLVDLITNRDWRSLQRRLVRPKKHELPALIAEQGHEYRMLREEILLELHLRVVIKPKHRNVECEHVLLSHLRFSRRSTVAHDDVHVIGRSLAGPGLRARTANAREVNDKEGDQCDNKARSRFDH